MRDAHDYSLMYYVKCSRDNESVRSLTRGSWSSKERELYKVKFFGHYPDLVDRQIDRQGVLLRRRSIYSGAVTRLAMGFRSRLHSTCSIPSTVPHLSLGIRLPIPSPYMCAPLQRIPISPVVLINPRVLSASHIGRMLYLGPFSLSEAYKTSRTTVHTRNRC